MAGGPRIAEQDERMIQVSLAASNDGARAWFDGGGECVRTLHSLLRCLRIEYVLLSGIVVYIIVCLVKGCRSRNVNNSEAVQGMKYE